jgi:type I restriction enzyme S subunit
MKKMRLGEIADVIAGQSPPSKTYNSTKDGLPFFQGKADFQEKHPKIRMWCNSKKRKEAEPGDILISVRAPVGSVNLCDRLSIIGRGLSAIRPRSGIHADYLYYFFKMNEDRVAILGTGSTFKSITQDILKKIEVPVPYQNGSPDLDDQTRIAILLSKVESLIAGRKKSIADLGELLKSTFLEMFGPVNPEFEKWPIVKIKDLAADHKGAMRTGPFGSNLLHSEFTKTGEVAVLGIDNAVQNRFSWGALRFITHEKYEKLKNYRIFPEDVIVTIMGTVGRSAVIPKNIPLAINTKHLAAITFDKKKANPIFMSYAIHSSPFIINQFINRNRGAIMSGLNLGIIKDTQINKPPVELQNQFATIAEKVEALKKKFQNSLNDLESLYDVLSQKAFKGELDLSRIAISEELKPKDIKMDAPQVRIPDLTEKTIC